jgi:uncharacterized repeat protein (TIGR01451 family)
MSRYRKNIRRNFAVTEIVGCILMLGMTTSSFSVVYYQVVSAPTPNPPPIVELSGKMVENQIIVTHRGGEPLDLDTELVLNIGGTRRSFKVGDFLDSRSKEDGVWCLGERFVYPIEYDFDYAMYPDLGINIFDSDTSSFLMTGITKVNPTCDVGVTVSADNLNPEEYEMVEFTLTVTNYWDINASGVLIEFPIPAGLIYVSSTMDKGSYDSDTGIWNVGQLLSGESIILTVKATVKEFPYSDTTQLVFILDGSGSISPESWSIALEGLSKVVGNNYSLPHNGAVELTVIQFGGKTPAFARVEVGPIVITEHNVEEILDDISNISQIKDRTPTSIGVYLAADTLYSSDMFDPDIRQVVFLVTDGNPTHCFGGVVDGSYIDGGCTDANGPKKDTIDGKNYLIDLLELTPDQDEFNVFSVDPVVDSKLRKDEITHIQWLKENIVWPQPSYYAPPYFEGSQSGWLRNVSTWSDLEYSINETFKVLFSEIPINVNIHSTAFSDPKVVNDLARIVLEPTLKTAEKSIEV